MKTKTGFTLVEVLIGLSIATTATVSVAYSIARTNRVADAGRKTFIATNLAHEGLELTRAKRDNVWFAPGAPADHSDWADTICGDLSDINGTQTIGTEPTEFTREVTVDCDNASNDPAFVEVASTVTWQSPTGQNKEVSITEKLYNWYVAPAL